MNAQSLVLMAGTGQIPSFFARQALWTIMQKVGTCIRGISWSSRVLLLSTDERLHELVIRQEDGALHGTLPDCQTSTSTVSTRTCMCKLSQIFGFPSKPSKKHPRFCLLSVRHGNNVYDNWRSLGSCSGCGHFEIGMASYLHILHSKFIFESCHGSWQWQNPCIKNERFRTGLPSLEE